MLRIKKLDIFIAKQFGLLFMEIRSCASFMFDLGPTLFWK